MIQIQTVGIQITSGSDTERRHWLSPRVKLYGTMVCKSTPKVLTLTIFTQNIWQIKEYTKARTYLLKARQAEDRLGRPLADEGRRKEIGIALDIVQEAIK